jgi:hypothetical protein
MNWVFYAGPSPPRLWPLPATVSRPSGRDADPPDASRAGGKRAAQAAITPPERPHKARDAHRESLPNKPLRGTPGPSTPQPDRQTGVHELDVVQKIGLDF